MRQVPRRHTAPKTVPWCRCGFKRPMAYVQHLGHMEEYYVHLECMKPSRRYWAVQQGQIIAGC